MTPAGVGPNELRVHLYRADSSDPGTVERVQLILSAPEVGGGDELLPEPQGDNIFIAIGSFSSLASAWDVAVDIRRAEFDDARITFEVPIEGDAGISAGQSSFGSPAPQIHTRYLWAMALALSGVGLLLFEPARRSALGMGMRVSGAGAVLIALVFAVTAWQAEDELLLENPSADDPQALVRGAAIYEGNCVACHGIGGAGDGPLSAALDPPPADLVYHVPLHTETETYLFIADGFPGSGMPAWGDELSSEEIWDVVNFLRRQFTAADSRSE